MPATLKQIAEYTQLSIPTVSEILNGKNRLYKEATKQRVMEAARQLGYRPNSSARSIKSGRFGTIALLQSSLEFRSLLPSTLLRGIETELNKRELLLLLGSVTDEELEARGSIPRLLKTWSTDGMLVNYISGYPQRLKEFVQHQRFPAVWLNAKLNSDCVYPDDERAAELATEYLIGLGHKHIALVNYNFGRYSSIPVHYSSLDRFAGYQTAMLRANLAPLDIRGDDRIPMEDRLEYSLTWLKQSSRPTAVLCYAIETAYPIIVAANRLNLKIPGDLSVMLFHDRITDTLGCFIDTILLPEREMGVMAVDLLMQKINGSHQSFPAVALPMEMATGWTTSPPKNR